MKRSENDFQVIAVSPEGFRYYAASEHGVKVAFVYLFSYRYDPAGFYAFFERDCFRSVKYVDLFSSLRNLAGVVRAQLRAVFPIHLVAVVFLGIV